MIMLDDGNNLVVSMHSLDLGLVSSNSKKLIELLDRLQSIVAKVGREDQVTWRPCCVGVFPVESTWDYLQHV